MNSKNLIIKYLAGQTSQSEEEQIRLLQADSPRNNDLYIQLQRIWSAAEPPVIHNAPDVSVEWQKLERSLTQRLSERRRDELVRRKWPVLPGVMDIRFRPVMVFAVLLIVMTALMFWRVMFYNPQLTLYTQSGQTKTIGLPDGSTLQLNSGSDVSFYKKFAKARQVILNGEAFFTVVPDDEPFTVITENSKTTVLGTRFNVWSRNNKTRVTVKKGRVYFGVTNKPGSGVILTAGQTGEIVADNPPGDPENTNLEYYLGWLDNRLMFHKTSLSEIVGELERFFNVTITIENVKADSLTVTGVFDRMPIEQVLSSICLTLDLHFNKTAGVFTISN